MNYQQKLEEILEKESNHLPTLLLQACCAPCSSYVLGIFIISFSNYDSLLQSQYYE